MTELSKEITGRGREIYESIIAEHGLTGEVDLGISRVLAELLVLGTGDVVRTAEAIARLRTLLPRPAAAVQTRISIRIIDDKNKGEYAKTIDEAMTSYRRQVERHPPEDGSAESADGDAVPCLEDPTRLPEGAHEPSNEVSPASAEPEQRYPLPDNVISWPGSS